MVAKNRCLYRHNNSCYFALTPDVRIVRHRLLDGGLNGGLSDETATLPILQGRNLARTRIQGWHIRQGVH